MLAARLRRSALALALSTGLAGACHADALSDTDLHQYGFGEAMVHTLHDSAVHEPARTIRAPDIPPPIVGAAPLSDKDIPEPSVGPTRLIPQGGRGQQPPYEGPTRLYQGSDGKELEGTFKEVENFFFRPNRHYDHFTSLSERDTTGLIQMMTAEIAPKGTTYGRAGIQYAQLRKAFGNGLINGQKIEQLVFPVVAMTVPSKDLEVAQSINMINEESTSFPLIPDYSLGGIRDVATTAKYRFLDNPEDRVSGAFAFTIRVGVENTVTRIGSNGVDYQMALAFTKRVHNMGLHADGGYIFANGQDRSNNRVPDVGFADIGLDFQTNPDLDFILEIGYTDFNNLGDRVEITPGLKWRISDRWRYDLGVLVTARDTMPQGYYTRISTAFQFKF